MFEKLEEYSISVKKCEQQYPWFITYDFESLMLKETHKIWHTTHKPVSVSVCSNVDGFQEPKFILDDNLDSLLSEMINYMNKISKHTLQLAKNKWKNVFKQLDKLDEQWGVNEKQSGFLQSISEN